MIKIPVSSFTKDSVVVTMKAPPPAPPAPTNPNSFKPSPGQELQRGVPTTPVALVPDGVQHQAAVGTCGPSAPPAERVSPQQELARHPSDLDIVCVDADTGVYSRKRPQVEFVDLVSSSDTDDSSDLEESDSEDDRPGALQRHVRPPMFQI